MLLAWRGMIPEVFAFARPPANGWFVVPPLGGIEAATKSQVPVKTGTTNGDYLNETPSTKNHRLNGTKGSVV